MKPGSRGGKSSSPGVEALVDVGQEVLVLIGALTGSSSISISPLVVVISTCGALAGSGRHQVGSSEQPAGTGEEGDFFSMGR